jgi:hypothetical protein
VGDRTIETCAASLGCVSPNYDVPTFSIARNDATLSVVVVGHRRSDDSIFPPILDVPL